MLYLIESDCFVKIGYTENLENRYNQYKTDNPNFRMLDIMDGNKETEHRLQALYSKFSLPNSEWCCNKALVFKIWKDYKESIGDYTEQLDLEEFIDTHSSHKIDIFHQRYTKEELL